MTADTRNVIPFDDKPAASEGWGLFMLDTFDGYGKRLCAIQADDESGAFADDFQAAAFVLNSTQDGSAYHRDALSLHLGCELRKGFEYDHNAPAFQATFTGQAWINNQALTVDDARHVFTVTRAEIDYAGGADPEDEDGLTPARGDWDGLQHAANAPAVVQEWSGPFEIELDPLP